MNPLPPMPRLTQPSPDTLRRRTLFMGMALAGLVASCATLLGPRTVEISRDELLAKMGKQFPMTKRVMKLLDVSAALPRLDLQGDKNRVALGVDLTARELIMGGEHKGQVVLSFGLRFEPKDLSIRLTQPRIEQVMVDGLPQVYQRALSTLGAQLVEDSLNDYVVHQLKPEDLRTADRMGYEVKDVQITATGLAIHLVPRP